MPEAVVVGLEMIGIDHQQRDWRRLTRRPPPFGIDDGIKFAPVAQPRQRVGGGELLELVLGLRAAADFARQKQRHRKHEGDQSYHDGADPNRFSAPKVEDAAQRLSDDDEEWTGAVTPDIEPRNGIDRTRPRI